MYDVDIPFKGERLVCNMCVFYRVKIIPISIRY